MSKLFKLLADVADVLENFRMTLPRPILAHLANANTSGLC